MTHRTVWVKVNAPVDEGVQGLVSALSLFPSLETVESCQGDQKRGPWVCFRYGAYWEHPWHELAEFVLGRLAPGLSEEIGDDATVRIQSTTSGQVFGEVAVRPGAAARVENALRRLANCVTVPPPRTMGCFDGTSGICREAVEGQYHFDHKIPLSAGGAHVASNIQITHPLCNLRKGARAVA